MTAAARIILGSRSPLGFYPKPSEAIRALLSVESFRGRSGSQPAETLSYPASYRMIRKPDHTGRSSVWCSLSRRPVARPRFESKTDDQASSFRTAYGKSKAWAMAAGQVSVRSRMRWMEP